MQCIGGYHRCIEGYHRCIEGLYSSVVKCPGVVLWVHWGNIMICVGWYHQWIRRVHSSWGISSVYWEDIMIYVWGIIYALGVFHNNTHSALLLNALMISPNALHTCYTGTYITRGSCRLACEQDLCLESLGNKNYLSGLGVNGRCNGKEGLYGNNSNCCVPITRWYTNRY